MLALFKEFPLGLHKLIGLQFRIGFNFGDAVFLKILCILFIKIAFTPVPFDSYRVKVGAVVLFQCTKDVNKSKREKISV